MNDFPAFDLYTQRWLAGTSSMSAAERGAYITLLCEQWERNGLPDDFKRLSAVARCRRSELLFILDKFPVCADGKRRNPRLEAVRAEQRERITRAKEKAKKASDARWHPNGSSIPSGNAQASAKHQPSITLSNPLPPTSDPSPLPTTHALPVPSTDSDDAGHSASAPEIGLAEAGMALRIVQAYPANGNRYEAQAAVIRAIANGEKAEAILAKVKAHAACFAALKPRDRQYCPGLATYFGEARWHDDPNFSPWTRHAAISRQQEEAEASKGAAKKFVATIPRAPALAKVADSERPSVADFAVAKNSLNHPT